MKTLNTIITTGIKNATTEKREIKGADGKQIICDKLKFAGYEMGKITAEAFEEGHGAEAIGTALLAHMGNSGLFGQQQFATGLQGGAWGTKANTPKKADLIASNSAKDAEIEKLKKALAKSK